MINIVIFASTLPLRAGFRSLLINAEGFDIVAEGAHWSTGFEIPQGTDVVLAADNSLEFAQLDEMLAELQDPPALLLLTDSPETLAKIINLPLRAWGILPSDPSEDELLAAVEVLDMGLAAGDISLINQALVERIRPDSDDELIEELSDREMDVLELLAEGLANKQIAYELNISDHTVKFHVSSIYNKLGASNRTEAVMTAARYGLILL